MERNGLETFELLSSGELIPLPSGPLPSGLPGDCRPHVLVFLPHCRSLLGAACFDRFETWFLGRPGEPLREISLPGKGNFSLSAGERGRILLTEEVVATLRSSLFRSIPPPGDHEATLSFMRDFLRHAPGTRVHLDEIDSSRGGRFPAPYLRSAYWGIRLALASGDRGSLGRINLWLRMARDAFDSADPPRLWTLLSGIPDEETQADLENLRIPSETLRRLDIEESNPSAVRTPGGYLVQYWREVFDLPSSDPLSARVLIFLRSSLFGDLRLRYGLSLRDIALASWGYAESRRAEESLGLPTGEDAEGVQEKVGERSSAGS
jgi:hypothetical protein